MNSRRIRDADDLDRVQLDDHGLVPVVAQSVRDGRVLMVAWANREALDRTLDSGEVHFWSRSRSELWKKGETSGNVLSLDSLRGDCDGDTILALVDPSGPACHTGDDTCFGDEADRRWESTLPGLWRTIEDRDADRPEGSYTTELLESENLRLKKLGEELVELISAIGSGKRKRVAEEAADLLYHLLVAMKGARVSLDDLLTVLEGRGS